VLELHVALVSLPLFIGAPAAAWIVGEEVALAVPSDDRMALFNHMGQIGLDDGLAKFFMEGKSVEAALLITNAADDDSSLWELCDGVPPERGTTVGVDDLLLIVNRDLGLLVVLTFIHGKTKNIVLCLHS
jgi:hypothetical protein